MKKSYFCCMGSVLLWSTMATIVKVVLNNIPNMQALAVSGLFAFLCLVIYNFASGAYRKMKKYKIKEYFQMAGLGFLGLFLYSALYYFAIGELSAQMACILNYLWPMMLVIFSSIILHEPLNVKKIIALVLSFIGIIVLVLSDSAGVSGNFVLGVISCIACAMCYGLFSVLNKQANMDQEISMMIMWLTVAICSFATGQLTEEWVAIAGTQWLGLLWLGIGTNAIAYLLWAIALKNEKGTAVIANLAYLVPFVSIVISGIFLDEKITVNMFVGLLLIVGGILLQSTGVKGEQ